MKHYELARILKELRHRHPNLEIREQEPMSAHCSFRIGGPCDAMVFPSSSEQIREIAELAGDAGERPLLVGNGTNLLITDDPLHRLVLKIGEPFSEIRRRASLLTAQSGASLAKLASFSAQECLGGLEFAHGIPGSLGGAVSMNAGAYGSEMKDVVTRVQYLDGDLRICETSTPDFSYRHSVFSGTDAIVLSAELHLTENEESAIRQRMQELAEKRRVSQPLDKPSAGSTFKRPAKGYASALIDEAGLRGFVCGGAQVSEKHCGFIINRGGATCEDVLRLMDIVISKVLKTSGIELEPEIKIIRNVTAEE